MPNQAKESVEIFIFFVSVLLLRIEWKSAFEATTEKIETFRHLRQYRLYNLKHGLPTCKLQCNADSAYCTLDNRPQI